MSKIEEFRDIVAQNESFISDAKEYIHTHMDSPTEEDILDGLQFVASNNEIINSNLKNQNLALQKIIDNAKSIEPISTSHIETTENNNIPVNKDITDIINYILYCNHETDLPIYLENLYLEDLIRVKLSFLKEIINLKKQIHLSVITNPTKDIQELQNKLIKYEQILNILKSYKKEEEQIEDNSLEEIKNHIIILPHNNTTYLYEDIIKYKERRKEIKNAFDKIINGYFLKTKDIDSIEDKSQSLYEYRNPNGIRILYITYADKIIICSLFFKNKNRSIKITNEYEEAINRYNEYFDYLKDNINNPDFYIKQEELVGEIYSFLDDTYALRKVGV